MRETNYIKYTPKNKLETNFTPYQYVKTSRQKDIGTLNLSI